jgi:hypothetical protein
VSVLQNVFHSFRQRCAKLTGRSSFDTAHSVRADDSWSSYVNPKFKSQKSCEQWVRSRAAKTAQPTMTPRSDTSTTARTPVAKATPPSPPRQ